MSGHILSVIEDRIGDLIFGGTTPNELARLQEARAAVAELIEAAELLLLLPIADERLSILKKGIGTKTADSAWIKLESALSRVRGAE